MAYYDDYDDERELDEMERFKAMLFRVQCRWRDYNELMTHPHSKKAELRLLDEIDVLEANLKEMGAYTTQEIPS